LSINPVLQSYQKQTNHRWLERLTAAAVDLRNGLQAWRMWWLLAISDIRQRYQRSSFGQFWLTLSMGATIAAIGLVYSVLFHQATANYLPYLGIGLVCWALVSGIVTDACGVFVQSADFIRQSRLPLSLFVNRMLLRNLIILGHNIPVVAIVMIIFHVPLTWEAALIVPGLMLTILTGLWIGLFLGTLCTRFGDLPQIIASLMQIAFFVTPVIYTPDAANYRLWMASHLNPFASYLALLRDPLLGRVPEAWHYGMAIVCMAVAFLLAFPMFARFRARIVFWL
jgi:ABC-type polysaccharide/polyol phosphate export permease